MLTKNPRSAMLPMPLHNHSMNRSRFASRVRFAHSNLSLGPVIVVVIRHYAQDCFCSSTGSCRRRVCTHRASFTFCHRPSCLLRSAALFSLDEIRRALADLKMGDGISTASICPDAFCRVTLPAVRVIRANHEIAISDFLRFVLGTIGVAAFQYVEIK